MRTLELSEIHEIYHHYIAMRDIHRKAEPNEIKSFPKEEVKDGTCHSRNYYSSLLEHKEDSHFEFTHPISS